jgi:hypothetical protein
VWLQDGAPHTISRPVAASNAPVPETLERSGVMRGKYVMRGDDSAAKWPSYIHVVAIPVGGDAPRRSVTSEGASNGEFVLRNVFGPRILSPGYTLDGTRWWFGGVLLDGVDVTDVPTDFSAKSDAKLEVVFIQHPAVIEGTVTTASGEPAAGAWVVILSANPALWQTPTTYKFQAGRDGRFTQRIRPARYLLAALPATPYQVQPILGDLPALAARATSVTAVDRARAPVELRLPR